MNSLDEARKIINEVDAKMAELFCKRMRAAEMVAAYKKEHGLKIYDAAREEEVVRRNSALVEDKELREYYVNFLKNNMAISRNYQDRIMSGMKIAYCGTEGAFAHIATAKLFPTAKKIAYGDFVSAYKAVEEGLCDAAVLPVENSYNGEVGQVTDLMFSGPLYINSIIELAVTHDLLATEGASLSDIKQVISHPQALAQCAEYQRRRDALCGGLRSIGWDVPNSKGTMFVWAHIPDGYSSTEEFWEALVDKAGVLCTPGTAFGPLGEGYVRFALTRPVEDIEKIVDAIARSGVISPKNR